MEKIDQQGRAINQQSIQILQKLSRLGLPESELITRYAMYVEGLS